MEHPTGVVEILKHVDDGSLKLKRADPIISLTLEVLVAMAADGLTFHRGDLVFGDLVRYRPMQWSTRDEALVCWKVAPESCRCPNGGDAST